MNGSYHHPNPPLFWMVELIAMPSTSPGSAALRPPEKEKLWHIACYNYANGQPPEQYICPGCDEHNINKNISGSKQKNRKKKMRHERHWFQDCPYRETPNETVVRTTHRKWNNNPRDKNRSSKSRVRTLNRFDGICNERTNEDERHAI